eukprot:SAG11_NODE_198_length_12679_cov_7.778537_2_plen_338_part_00
MLQTNGRLALMAAAAVACGARAGSGPDAGEQLLGFWLVPGDPISPRSNACAAPLVDIAGFVMDWSSMGDNTSVAMAKCGAAGMKNLLRLDLGPYRGRRLVPSVETPYMYHMPAVLSPRAQRLGDGAAGVLQRPQRHPVRQHVMRVLQHRRPERQGPPVQRPAALRLEARASAAGKLHGGVEKLAVHSQAAARCERAARRVPRRRAAAGRPAAVQPQLSRRPHPRRLPARRAARVPDLRKRRLRAYQGRDRRRQPPDQLGESECRALARAAEHRLDQHGLLPPERELHANLSQGVRGGPLPSAEPAPACSGCACRLRSYGQSGRHPDRPGGQLVAATI